MASRIEDYGMIGDGQTVALVSKTGSIDWWCAPHFDSDACFAALLGYDQHGCWICRPTSPLRASRQHYDGDTLVLVTEFLCEGGVARIVDFMPPSLVRTDIIRIVEGVAGSVSFESRLAPRFGYGADQPWIVCTADSVTMTAGPDALRLSTTAATTVGQGNIDSQFTVRQGEQVAFQLAWLPSHQACPRALDVASERARTAAYWNDWARQCTYRGVYGEATLRSLLTLKALTYVPTGAIVAAPTSSLPEQIGGVRNWDYRFCWLRDATLTINAFLFGGYLEEATAFRDWLLRTVAGDPRQVQIMYDIHGGRRLTELQLDALPGYEGSRPVRIGNAASEQLQLDIFGEVLGSVYLARTLGMRAAPAWAPVAVLLDHIERIWQQPDEGIWEVRGGRKHFTYSKVMTWVAIDRAVHLIDELGVGGDSARDRVPHLCALRDRIHEEVCDRGFNPRIGAFTQYYGGETLDASVLLIPHTGFLPATDPRMLSTVAAIERDLVRDGLVLRYLANEEADGLSGAEGAFLACSFWLADNYAMAGRLNEAKQLFERLLELRNHLGLLAEEYDPRLRRQLGNFPQAFSHLALIATARTLEIASRRAAAEAESMQSAHP